jgi:hypothetical protein
MLIITHHMKKLLIPVIALVLLLTGTGVASGQNKDKKASKQEQRAAELDQVVSLIESGNYMYTIQSINPTGGRTIRSTSQYTMNATDGNYEATLPYFGRAYQTTYGGSGSIEFNGAPENLKLTRDEKKNTVTITFSIKGSTDNYNISLNVGYSGYGTLTINSQNRQSISYYGLVSEPGQ